MHDFIRFGDSTTGGGKVISASSTLRIGGRFVVRAGDQVTCPTHPSVNPNLILLGSTSVRDHGHAAARNGDMALCGCKLLSSL
jgi:uncharacterized Zn-binding protein involved in type VI secretion